MLARLVFAAALAIADAALAQDAPTRGLVFDTPRFTIILPTGFQEIRHLDKDQPLFFFSDSGVDPQSRRAFIVMFFEGGDFKGGGKGTMLETIAAGLSQRHANFRNSKPYYLDPSKTELCSQWSGDAGNTPFTGMACEIRIPAGFVVLHAMDASASFPAREAAFRTTMLSFQLKN